MQRLEHFTSDAIIEEAEILKSPNRRILRESEKFLDNGTSKLSLRELFSRKKGRGRAVCSGDKNRENATRIVHSIASGLRARSRNSHDWTIRTFIRDREASQVPDSGFSQVLIVRHGMRV